MRFRNLGSPALTSLAQDWRMLPFPEASDKTFADGYAQAVTFGLLMARAKNIRLADGFDKVGRELARNKMVEAHCLASSGSESSPGVLYHM